MATDNERDAPGMLRLVERGIREVLAAYPSTEGVYEAVKRVNEAEGARGVCALCIGLVRATAPPWVLQAGASGSTVFPMNMTTDDDPKHQTATNVMRFMAAVIADDVDMAIALYKAVVEPPASSQDFADWLHVLISTTCEAAVHG
jgi:hypothetical protein